MNAFWFNSSLFGPVSSNFAVCGHITLVSHLTLLQGSAILSQPHTYSRAQLSAASLISGPLHTSSLIWFLGYIFLSWYLLLMWFLGDPNENVQEVVCDVADSFKPNSCFLGYMPDFIWCLMVLLWFSIPLTGLCEVLFKQIHSLVSAFWELMPSNSQRLKGHRATLRMSGKPV